VVTHVDRLREVALDQHGLVTYRQALDAGVSQPELSKLAARERIERVARGVYRVPQVPGREFAPFMEAVLWTGAPEACLSHDTALAARDISDISPDAIHLCVGARRRLRRAGGDRYVIHHQGLVSGQVGWWQGVPCVTTATAIEQCIASGVPTYLLRQAIANAGRTSDLLAEDAQRLTHALEVRHFRD